MKEGILTFDPPLPVSLMPMIGWRTLEQEVRDGATYIIRAQMLELCAVSDDMLAPRET